MRPICSIPRCFAQRHRLSSGWRAASGLPAACRLAFLRGKYRAFAATLSFGGVKLTVHFSIRLRQYLSLGIDRRMENSYLCAAKFEYTNASIGIEERRIGHHPQGKRPRRIPPPNHGDGLCARAARRGPAQRSVEGPHRIPNHGIRHLAAAERSRHGGGALRQRSPAAGRRTGSPPHSR